MKREREREIHKISTDRVSLVQWWHHLSKIYRILPFLSIVLSVPLSQYVFLITFARLILFVSSSCLLIFLLLQAIVAKCAFPVYLWNDFLNLGSAITTAALETRMSNIRCGNCSTLIYTSGACIFRASYLSLTLPYLSSNLTCNHSNNCSSLPPTLPPFLSLLPLPPLLLQAPPVLPRRWWSPTITSHGLLEWVY